MAKTPLSPYDQALSEIADNSLSVFKPATQPTERQPSTSGSSVPESLVPLFDSASSKYQVPVNVIMALAQQESGFNPTALGTQTKWGRAKGLMQYLDTTAAGMGINPYDPAQSIDAAAKQIRQRLDKGYSMEDAVKEHFAGPNRKMWGAKTAQYGVDVMRRAQNFLNGYQAGPESASQQQTPADDTGSAPSPLNDEAQQSWNDEQSQKTLADLNADEPGRYSIPTPQQMAVFEKTGSMPPPDPLTENIIAADAAKQAVAKIDPPANKDGNIFTDTLNLLESGLNSAAANAQEMVSYIPVVGPAIVDAADRFDKWANGKSSKELFKQKEDAVAANWSPDMLAARKKDFVTESPEGYSFGPAWSDPRAYYSGLVESLPETVLTMGAAGRLAKGAYSSMLAKGATKAEAAKRAATVATLAGGIIEGGMGGAASSRQVRDEINSMTREQLKDSEVLKSLMGDGKTFEQARSTLADDSASKAFVVAGIGTGIFGGFGDRALAKIITTPMMGRLKSAAKGAVAEGLLEEMPQSALQQAGENYAMQGADPTRPLSKGVANAAAQGAAIGGIMGAGMGAAAPHVSADVTESATDQPSADPMMDNPPVAEVREPQPTVSGPIGRALQQTVTQAQESGQPIKASGQWFGEPGSKQTVTVEGVDPFSATVDSYAPNGDVVLRDDSNGEILQFGPDELEIAKQAAQEAAQQQETAGETETETQTVSQSDERIDPETGEIISSIPTVEYEGPHSRAYGEMTESELRDRLKYVATQAKSSGWDKRLTGERRKIEAAIDAKTENVRNERSEGAEIPAPAQSDNAATVQSDESGAATQQSAELSAGKPVSGRGSDDVSVSATTDANPALNKDGSQKWFGTERKANDYLARKGIADTHEIKLVDRRFEVHPKTEDGPLIDEGASAPAAKPVKGRVPGGPRVNRVRKLLGAEIGDTIIPQGDVGYIKAGERYKIDSIEKSGTVHVTNVDTGGGTSITLADLDRGNSRNVHFDREVAEAAAAERSADNQADSMRELRNRARSSRPDVDSVSNTETPNKGSQRKSEWQSFPADSGTLNIPRADMPQIKAEHRGAMVNFLNARGVTHREGMVPADTLKPTQSEFSPERVSRAASRTEGDRSILVSNDGYVLDGHHQWLAARDSRDNVKAIVFDEPISSLISLAREFPSSTVDTSSAPDTAKNTAKAPQTEPLSSQGAPVSVDSAPDATKAADYGANNKLVSQDRAAELRQRLKAKFSQLNSGIDPEILAIGTELAVFHIEASARKFSDFARAMASDLDIPLPRLRPYLRSWYNGARDMMEDSGVNVSGMDSPDVVRAEMAKLDQPVAPETAAPVTEAPAQETRQPGRETGALDDMVNQFDSEVENVPGRRDSVEPDIQTAGNPLSSNENADVNESGGNDGSIAAAGRLADTERGAGQRNQRVSDTGADAGRGRSDQRVHQQNGQFDVEGSTTGSAERAGSRSDSDTGSTVERGRAAAVTRNADAAGASNLNQRLAAQKKATKAPTKWGDRESIDNALPLLLPDQRGDVLKVEQQHAKMPGILITNGTGTGKTASGMGVAKRYANAGKDNILILVPTDKIASDWVKFGGMMDLPVKQLDGVTDNGGKGPVITTYANMGQNNALAQRNWDLIIPDEAHYLSSNEKGESTAALDKLRALSGHHAGFSEWMRSRYAKEWQAIQDATEKSQGGDQAAITRLERLNTEWDEMAKPLRQQWQERWEAQQDNTKVVFLSATPFAYVKNVDYAEGYLFHYTPPADRYKDRNNGGYNSASDQQQFMMQHFGYRMRYNKLTQPEAGVNSELMEQGFNQHLKDTGALTGRTLDVPHDYDRKFALIDDAAGRKLDNALRFLNEAENGKYRPIYDEVMRTFDYQRRMFLLESMKARAAVPMIKQHLALGRKVVVFHDYNKGGGFSPFAESLNTIKTEMRSTASELFQRPEFQIDFSGLLPAITTIKRAFPKAMEFNGTVSKAQRRKNADLFNDDNSGRNLMIVQSDAGREGVSLHDTTGKHQRTLINLGMPVKPVAATQIEGRTYRTGQASDAIFRYMTTGTAWEASAFASKIAERASTAENLALGNDARGLKQSFIDAYNDADVMSASREDGKGGKELDRSLSAGRDISPFQRAKTFYYAQQKNNKRRDNREGKDYFATPEPVGLKMVEWADIKPGDKVLEPSAGHGAIARFFPDRTDVTMIEPSYELSNRAALANGTAKIVNSNFEDFHVTNKFDAIVMNPPYGNGGKTAIEHVGKAARHLREGGRIVAIIPRGGMADRRLAQFMQSEEAKGLQLVADIAMPSSTFTRAGTGVNTHVLVLEKHSSEGDTVPPTTADLSNADSIEALFDRIEDLGVSPRQQVSTEEAIANATTNARYSVSDVQSSLSRGELGDAATRLIDAGQVQLHAVAPEGVPPGTQGWTDEQGVIHLVADRLNPANATSVLLHEAFHAGARPLVGETRWKNLNERFERLLRGAENRQSMGMEPGNDWDRAYSRIMIAEGVGDQMDRVRAREELAAYAVENFERMPAGIRKWVQSVIGAVKEFVARRFGKQLGEVTPAQLRSMAKAALQSGQTVGRDTVATSVQDPTPPTDAEINSWIGEKWEATREMSDSALKAVMPTLLHWTPSRVILTRVGKDMSALKEYADTKLKMDTFRDDWHAMTDKLAQRWTKYRAMNRVENSELMALMHESTLAQVDPSEKFKPSVTAFDEAALRAGNPQSEAFQQAEQRVADDKRRLNDHTAMQERFNKLSPEAQQLYQDVRDIYGQLADTQEQIIADNLLKAMEYRVKEAERQYDDEIQRIRDEGLRGEEATEAVAAAKKALDNAKKRDAWNRKARITKLRQEFESNRLAGPYFPLSRFGDYFVTARDKGTGQVVSFSRAESAFEQRRIRKDLERKGYDVEEGVVSTDADLRKQVPPDFVARIEDILKDMPSSKETQDQVWQLYLQTMPDYSLRKNRIHRKGRAGFEEDALRAFASHMFHGAHQTARLKYAMDLGDLIEVARRQAKTTRSPVRSGLVVNQVEKNHQYVMNPTSNRISQVATQGAFMWFLAQSPAAALVNMSQTYIIGVPKLASYHGGNTAAGMAVGLAETSKAMADVTRGGFFGNRSPRVKEDEKKALESAYRSGLITRTQSHDVAGIADSGIKYSAYRAKIMAGLSWMFHHTERVNRETSFLAGYRMARKKGLSHEAAIDKASTLTWDIHFDYQNTSRPAVMHSNTGKALLVFRNYSLNMLADMAYNTYSMINPRNPAERKEARTQMLGVGTMLAFNAGIRGLPLYGIAMMIAGMFSDDGEDPETELKKTLQEYLPPSMVGMMMDGVPGYATGVEISQRIGFGDLWFRSDDRDREGDDAYNYWLQQVLGASVAIPANWVRGVGQISQGYTWRGMETMLPKALKDPMKAYRYATEGAETKNGDPIIDDVNGWDIFKQAVGFTPAAISEQYKINSINMNKQKAILAKRSKLLADYYKADQAGDESKLEKVGKQIDEFSDKYPEMQINNKAIRRSMKNRDRYRDTNTGGMSYNNNLRERLIEEQPAKVYRSE